MERLWLAEKERNSSWLPWSRFERWCSTLPNLQTKTRNNKTEGLKSEKSLQTTLRSFRNSSLSLTTPLPHVLSSPFTARPRRMASLAVPVGSDSTPATRPHAFPGTSGPWQLKATLASSSRKRTPFRLTNPVRQHAKQGFPHCARENRTKKGLHFQTTIRRRCPSPYLHMSAESRD